MENKNKDVLQKTIRINRFLAMSGIASRRAAEEVVLAGEVRVNGKVIESLGTQVDPLNDSVTVRGKRVALAEHMIYILMNKPKDYITTAKDEQERRTVYDLLSIKERVFPIGRLDRNTTGVLLFTNDGFLASKLMHPSSEVKKEYHVSIDHSLDESHRDKLEKGIYLDDGKTAPAEIAPVPGTKNKEIVVTIHEGRNRQVRRMFETLGYEIIRLHRISYGGVTAGGLTRGKWRFLTEQEVRTLKSLVGTKTGAPKSARSKPKSLRPKFTTADPRYRASDGKAEQSVTAFAAGSKFKPAGSKPAAKSSKFSPAGSKFAPKSSKFSPAGSKFAPKGSKFSTAGSKFKSTGTKSKPAEEKSYSVETKSKTMRHRKPFRNAR